MYTKDMTTRTIFSAQIEADIERHGLETKEFSSFDAALDYAEKNMGTKYARVERHEQSQDENGEWSTDKYIVEVETTPDGWCDWRGGDPDNDIIPYQK